MTDEIDIERLATTSPAAEVSLDEHLTCEQLLADLSARFASASGDQLEAEIERGLKQLLEFLFDDQAMTLATIDRLVHHATFLEMNVESYRRKVALKRKRGPTD